MTNDMTKGKILPLIMNFMIPVTLGNLFQQFYNIADSLIAGRFIGVDALAAIGSTTSLIFLVIGWLNGITSGFAIMIAQAFGARSYKLLRHYLAVAIYLCIGMVVIMTIGLEIFNYPILRLMNAPENIIDSIAGYMGIIYAGLIVTALYNAAAAVLRALGDSRSPLYFLIISAVINVVLDIVFIICFGMGVEGCGYATVIAQGISAVLCTLYMIKKFEILHLKKGDWGFSFETAGHMLALGIPMALQFSITAIGTIIVQGAINIYGAVYMAGFSAAGKIQSMICTIFISAGATIATFVGQNRGAGRIDRVKEGVKITQILLLIFSTVSMAAVLLLGKVLTELFVGKDAPEVVDAAMVYFKVIVWYYPFLASIFLYRNALQGLGFGFVPMMGGVFELIARIIVVMLMSGTAGYAGVCFSDPLAWVFALLPIVPYYYYKIRKM